MQYTINIYEAADYEGMRAAGRLAAEVLDYITDFVEVGTTTDHLNQLCHEFIISRNAIPAPLNYKGFPKSICTSLNHVVCHGIPNEKKLQEGDILNIDVTVILNGYYGDSSRMYVAGKAPIKAMKLIANTYECLMLGIEQVKPGVQLKEIGRAIEAHAKKSGFSVVRDFCGHGIGKRFHENPSVLHYYEPALEVELKEGMFFTIEPMINAGDWKVKVLADGWTAVTRDKSLSAQFEHTIGVTATGCEIFTLSPKGYTLPPYR